MSYIVLARKYRSQDFGELVGQSAVAKTLMSAIHSGRLAHAYLFTGTRGVGKTSSARLFARALNAPDTLPGTPHGEGKTYPSPDIQQRMAEAIMRGDDLNVIEIDGASNNSVDQARELIAKAGLSPVSGAPYKIYIIDEVHMLSTAAFNALLKTMEEPPAHVKFILCTTEPHKIPATIHSRCQKFNFRSIPAAEVKKHLADLCAKEGIEAHEDVLFQVASLGGGSMRDSLSLLDRLIASGAKPVTLQVLEDMLGLPPQTGVAELIDAIAKGDAAAALDSTDRLLRSGIAQEQLVDALIERLRHLMIACACGAASPIIEASEATRATLAAQAKHFDAPGLVYTITLCENLKRLAKDSTTSRAMLDAAVVRLALAEKMADLPALLARQGTAVQAESLKKKLSIEDVVVTTLPEAERSPPRLPPPALAVPQAAPEAAVRPAAARPPPLPPAHAGRVSSPAEAWKSVAARPSSAWMDSFRLAKSQPDPGILWIEALPGKTSMAVTARTKMAALSTELGTLLGTTLETRLAAESAMMAPSAPMIGSFPRGQVMALSLMRETLEIFPDAAVYDAQPWLGEKNGTGTLANPVDSGDNAGPDDPND